MYVFVNVCFESHLYYTCIFYVLNLTYITPVYSMFKFVLTIQITSYSEQIVSIISKRELGKRKSSISELGYFRTYLCIISINSL